MKNQSKMESPSKSQLGPRMSIINTGSSGLGNSKLDLILIK